MPDGLRGLLGIDVELIRCQTRAACLVNSSKHVRATPSLQQQISGGGRTRRRVSVHSPCLVWKHQRRLRHVAHVVQGSPNTMPKTVQHRRQLLCCCSLPRELSCAIMRDTMEKVDCEMGCGMCLLISRTQRVLFGLQRTGGGVGWRHAACKSCSAAQGSCERLLWDHRTSKPRGILCLQELCRFRLGAQRLRRQRVVGISSSWQGWYRTLAIPCKDPGERCLLILVDCRKRVLLVFAGWRIQRQVRR